ncbi:hypothetical protein BDV39DRAFT_205878 [Aspergillus sergii]|uniref:Uncharacterized protein n=1 Tax=Aspergillus sergii TaxID=1034303 RepID=A0A5N6X0W2_9EURO|nr:hypothetical protein BDV39DRAFT_205878 [Aspergillus sergii]
MPKVSIAQAVSYELTDDRMLKAVLLDDEGNEHESELFLDDYLVVNDYRAQFREYHSDYQKGVCDMNSHNMFIHENTKWGPMLCINFSYATDSTYNVNQRLHMAMHFWNDNGTLRFTESAQGMEGIPHPDEYWQMYWDDFSEVEEYAQDYNILEDLFQERLAEVFWGYELLGRAHEFAFVKRSIQRHLDASK